jgi:hypothetical protein
MFENMQHQNVADQIKRLILAVRPRRDRAVADQKRRAIRALKAFEACGWYPWLLGEVVKAAGPGRLIKDEQGRLACESGADQPGEAVATILAVLENYLARAGCPLPADPEIFSVADAAEYLGLSPRGIKYHLYETGQLTGEVKGKTLVFTREELDRFNEARQEVGRPRKDQ